MINIQKPWIVKDDDYKREWVFRAPMQFYLWQDKDGFWSVIDRYLDVSVTKPFKTKLAAIRNFHKNNGMSKEEADKIHFGRA